jgi:dsRNA-specific ribonuclease
VPSLSTAGISLACADGAAEAGRLADIKIVQIRNVLANMNTSADSARIIVRARRKVAAVYDPGAIRNRLNRYMKRRLSDELEAVIHAAYLSGDLETAEELLVILQNKRERDARKYDQRISNDLAEHRRATHWKCPDLTEAITRNYQGRCSKQTLI